MSSRTEAPSALARGVIRSEELESSGNETHMEIIKDQGGGNKSSSLVPSLLYKCQSYNICSIIWHIHC
jgi:hypothetical protein